MIGELNNFLYSFPSSSSPVPCLHLSSIKEGTFDGHKQDNKHMMCVYILPAVALVMAEA